MAGQPIEDLVHPIEGVPNGRTVLAKDAAGNVVVATMVHRPDGQRVWRVSPVISGDQWIPAQEDLMTWVEVPEI